MTEAIRGLWNRIGRTEASVRAMLLSENNIKAELSYAYLHAVASRAGFSCEYSNRHEDGIGIDAKLRVRERFALDSKLTNFSVDVQLKSTSSTPVEENGRYSYRLPIKNYDELRSEECQAPQLLIVLFLPSNDAEWLMHSVERLVCQRCAYWLSLRGAPPSGNKSAQTVYIPTENYLSVAGLRELMTRFSRLEAVPYEP